MQLTCASESDDGHGDERDAVGRGGREGVAADVEEGDEQEDDERQNVADADAQSEAELLDEHVADDDADERRADVRQTHVEHDRRRRVPALNARTPHERDTQRPFTLNAEHSGAATRVYAYNGELVADLLVSWTAMEFCLSRAILFASSSLRGLRPAREPVSYTHLTLPTIYSV